MRLEEREKMKKKWMIGIVFLCNLLVFVICVNLFFNMGVYADEHNTTPSVVCGGEFWLLADWLRLVLSGISAVVSGIALFYAAKEK